MSCRRLKEPGLRSFCWVNCDGYVAMGTKGFIFFLIEDHLINDKNSKNKRGEVAEFSSSQKIIRQSYSLYMRTDCSLGKTKQM